MNSYQLFLTIEEINLILTALGKQPCEDVFDVVVNIRQQATAQQQDQQQQAQAAAFVDGQQQAQAPKPRRPRKTQPTEE